MLDKLQAVENRFEELCFKSEQPDFYNDPKKAAAFLGSDFDIEVIEKHHNQKLDAPSGTALLIADAINDSPELLQLMEDYDDIKRVLTVACKIQGIPRNTSTHAAGIVITKYDLVNYTPLDEGLDDIYQTQ